MPGLQRSGLLFAAGGDVLARYGTLTRRYQIPQLGGEGGKEVFTRAGPALGISKGGILVPVANNVPVVDYLTDPVTGLVQAYLRLEPAVPNKLTAPEDLTNAAWIKGGATIPSSNNISPRGDATACFLREDASNGQHHLQQGYVLAVAGNSVGATFFLKARGRTKVQLIIANPGFTSWFGVVADLVAGTLTPNNVGTGALTFSHIIPLPNGEFMVQVYGKVDSGVATSILWDLYLSNGASTAYAGDGASGMEVWGCVGTDNQIAGSYWGTGASRVADLVIVPYYTAPQAGDWLYLRTLENGGAFINGYPSYLALGDGNVPTLRIFGANQNIANSYGVAFWNTANIERDMGGGAMGNVIEVFAGLDQNLNFLSQLAVNGIVGAAGSTPIAQALPAAWGVGGFVLTMKGPSKVSRLLHGLGCGTSVATLADARAIPV